MLTVLTFLFIRRTRPVRTLRGPYSDEGGHTGAHHVLDRLLPPDAVAELTGKLALDRITGCQGCGSGITDDRNNRVSERDTSKNRGQRLFSRLHQRRMKRPAYREGTVRLAPLAFAMSAALATLSTSPLMTSCPGLLKLAITAPVSRQTSASTASSSQAPPTCCQGVLYRRHASNGRDSRARKTVVAKSVTPAAPRAVYLPRL